MSKTNTNKEVEVMRTEFLSLTRDLIRQNPTLGIKRVTEYRVFKARTIRLIGMYNEYDEFLCWAIKVAAQRNRNLEVPEHLSLCIREHLSSTKRGWIFSFCEELAKKWSENRNINTTRDTINQCLIDIAACFNKENSITDNMESARFITVRFLWWYETLKP